MSNTNSLQRAFDQGYRDFMGGFLDNPNKYENSLAYLEWIRGTWKAYDDCLKECQRRENDIACDPIHIRHNE